MSITKKQLQLVCKLEDEKKKLEDIVSSFESRHVRCCVGLVDEYPNVSSHLGKEVSSHANYFHARFKALHEKMTKEVYSEIKHRIKQIDLELSKYITVDDVDV